MNGEAIHFHIERLHSLFLGEGCNSNFPSPALLCQPAKDNGACWGCEAPDVITDVFRTWPIGCLLRCGLLRKGRSGAKAAASNWPIRNTESVAFRYPCRVRTPIASECLTNQPIGPSTVQTVCTEAPREEAFTEAPPRALAGFLLSEHSCRNFYLKGHRLSLT